MATTRSLDGALLDLALSVRQRPVRAGDDTDARILVESIQLFARRGYAGTSMREIAAAVGIQPASIYSHFGSKQQILADALDDVLYQFHSFILDATIPGGEPREQLRRVVGAARPLAAGLAARGRLVGRAVGDRGRRGQRRRAAP